ncbi:hypothetical protein ACQCSX_19085 [Pseudarthrobacter sp. P1]|uniref:hypothetical protein n=1 Tax=Pseudarthrobacter sp. P1 TaxID=3418418 RepID=UPI003CF9C3E9
MPYLILCSDLDSVGQDARRLSREAAAGRLVRIRRGAYVARGQWDAASARERYGTRVLAYNRTTAVQPVFALETAAVAWGLWLVGTPTELHLRTQFSGGGRSTRGIRRHLLPLDAEAEPLGELLVLPKAHTAVELAARLPFAKAVAVVDSSRRALREPAADPRLGPGWAAESLLGDPVQPAELQALAEQLPSAAMVRRALRVVEFSTHLAESAGESISRATIHILGFPAPELQCKFTLGNGERTRSDFHWPRHRLVGEFDGHGKYVRPDWGGGLSTADRLIAEKKREDGIRALGFGFARWDWKELNQPPVLARILSDAGLPQGSGRRRAS